MNLKKLSFVVVTGVSLSIAHADVNRIIYRLDNKIENQKKIISKISSYEKKVQAVQKDYSDNEANLWNSINETYDFLKSYHLEERYLFLYEASRAASQNQERRIDAFREWIKNENQRMHNRNITTRFYPQWKNYVEKINTNLNTVEASKVSHFREIDINQIQQENLKFLSLLRSDLKNLNIPSENKITLITHGNNSISPFNTKNYIFAAITFILVMFASYFLGKQRFKNNLRKKIKARKQSFDSQESRSVILPSLPEQNFDLNESKTVTTTANLEDECRKTFEENSYLLEAAELKFYQPSRSPFKTTINAEPEKIKEALSWLIKGTIAVSNFQAKKNSYIEWSCKETSGRVFLELIIHGVECDFKKMYYNALIDGTSSAPAHFGRSEMALEGHLPAIAFKSSSNKTTVSLGLDSSRNTINH